MAQVVLQKAKSSQTKLFFAFYAIISLLTIITSNDIIILTFTPFICYFAKHARIDPTPYIVSEFVAANTWSMFLIIGNPTNIYLATAFNINFFDYLLKMALPTIVAGIVSLSILYLLFRKNLSQKLRKTEEEVTPLNKTHLTIGLIGLISAIVLMAISSYIGLEMWYISLICVLLTFTAIFTVCIIKKEPFTILKNSLSKIPYALIPFLFGMTIIVICLNSLGITQSIANLLSGSNLMLIGIFALILSNLINNIPMSILMSSVITLMPTVAQTGVVYSSIIASNICAFFTPIGALAGIMFMKILKDSKVEFSFLKFTMYGLIICLPTILSTLASLLIVI